MSCDDTLTEQQAEQQFKHRTLPPDTKQRERKNSCTSIGSYKDKDDVRCDRLKGHNGRHRGRYYFSIDGGPIQYERIYWDRK
jgi:hypothetical protein